MGRSGRPLHIVLAELELSNEKEHLIKQETLNYLKSTKRLSASAHQVIRAESWKVFSRNFLAEHGKDFFHHNSARWMWPGDAQELVPRIAEIMARQWRHQCENSKRVAHPLRRNRSQESADAEVIIAYAEGSHMEIEPSQQDLRNVELESNVESVRASRRLSARDQTISSPAYSHRSGVTRPPLNREFQRRARSSASDLIQDAVDEARSGIGTPGPEALGSKLAGRGDLDAQNRSTYTAINSLEPGNFGLTPSPGPSHDTTAVMMSQPVVDATRSPHLNRSQDSAPTLDRLKTITISGPDGIWGNLAQASMRHVLEEFQGRLTMELRHSSDFSQAPFFEDYEQRKYELVFGKLSELNNFLQLRQRHQDDGTLLNSLIKKIRLEQSYLRMYVDEDFLDEHEAQGYLFAYDKVTEIVAYLKSRVVKASSKLDLATRRGVIQSMSAM